VILEPEGLRIHIRPLYGSARSLDVTEALIEALARQLWRLHGGNETANRVEALLLLEQLVGARRRSGGAAVDGEPER